MGGGVRHDEGDRDFGEEGRKRRRRGDFLEGEEGERASLKAGDDVEGERIGARLDSRRGRKKILHAAVRIRDAAADFAPGRADARRPTRAFFVPPLPSLSFTLRRIRIPGLGLPVAEIQDMRGDGRTGRGHVPSTSSFSILSRVIFLCSSAAIRSSRSVGFASRSFRPARSESAGTPAAQAMKTKPNRFS